MRPAFLLTLVLLVVLFSGTWQQPRGPHGGTVKAAGNYHIEMRNTFTEFYTWLLDKKMKTISNKGITCKVQFFFADSTSVDAELKPEGTEAFTTSTAVPAFSVCRVTYDLSGKEVTARFSNEVTLVKKNR